MKLIITLQGKGAKDRITLFPESIKEELLKYLLKYSPKNYLFESNRNKKYSAKSIEKTIEKSSIKAIGRKIRPHVLRHSFATHLLENRVDIGHIQKLPDPAKLKTAKI